MRNVRGTHFILTTEDISHAFDFLQQVKQDLRADDGRWRPHVIRRVAALRYYLRRLITEQPYLSDTFLSTVLSVDVATHTCKVRTLEGATFDNVKYYPPTRPPRVGRTYKVYAESYLRTGTVDDLEIQPVLLERWLATHSAYQWYCLAAPMDIWGDEGYDIQKYGVQTAVWPLPTERGASTSGPFEFLFEPIALPLPSAPTVPYDLFFAGVQGNEYFVILQYNRIEPNGADPSYIDFYDINTYELKYRRLGPPLLNSAVALERSSVGDKTIWCDPSPGSQTMFFGSLEATRRFQISPTLTEYEYDFLLYRSDDNGQTWRLVLQVPTLISFSGVHYSVGQGAIWHDEQGKAHIFISAIKQSGTQVRSMHGSVLLSDTGDILPINGPPNTFGILSCEWAERTPNGWNVVCRWYTDLLPLYGGPGPGKAKFYRRQDGQWKIWQPESLFAVFGERTNYIAISQDGSQALLTMWVASDPYWEISLWQTTDAGQTWTALPWRVPVHMGKVGIGVLVNR